MKITQKWEGGRCFKKFVLETIFFKRALFDSVAKSN